MHAAQLKRRRRDNIIALVGGTVIVALAALTQVVYFTQGSGTPVPSATPSGTPTDAPTPTDSPTPSATPEAGENVGDIPSPDAAEGRDWTGTLGLNAVQLGITLEGAAAPQAVAAFVTEAKKGYFTGKKCHRLASSDSFKLLQCGSSDGSSAGDTDYAFGPIENAPADNVYPAGTIAMARAGGDAYSQGHQFFITFADTTIPSDSAGGYTVIGTVTSGLDQLVSQIASGGIVDGASDGAPVIPTSITGLTVQ